MKKALLLKALNKINKKVWIFALNIQEEMVFYTTKNGKMLIAIVHNGHKKVIVYNWLTINELKVCRELYPGYEFDVRFEPTGLVLTNWDGTNPYGFGDLFLMKQDTKDIRTAFKNIYLALNKLVTLTPELISQLETENSVE